MRNHVVVALALASMVAAGGCGARSIDSNTDTTTDPPSQVMFDLRNDGAASAYLFEGCTLNLTITSLADPTRAIGRGGDCACSCSNASCTGNVVCGACYQGSLEIAGGAMYPYTWEAADISVENRSTYQCVRVQSLPAGRYRIDVPVYGSAADASSQTGAHVATATFDVPNSEHVVVSLAPSP